MKETFVLNNSTDTEIIFFINRDTGEIRLFNDYFLLDFLSNTVFMLENETLIPICIGHQDSHHQWHFKGLGIEKTDKDPFVAAFKALYEMLKR